MKIRDDRGSQIVELAVALPFLVVLLWGIMDFGNAFNTKQKISTAAREVARYSSNQSTLDLSEDDPPSIEAAKNVLASTLVNAHLNPCGIDSNVTPAKSDVETWAFTSQGNCPDKLILKIERANVFQMADGTNVISTRVTVTYPLVWHFGKVVWLIAKGANYGGSSIQISVQSVMANLT